MRKFKTYKSPLFDGDGRVLGTVGVARDVTDLQNLQIEVNDLALKDEACNYTRPQFL